jgi:ADP-ribosylglycohydrolase
VRDSLALQDRCRGVLLGLAAGDRNGGPVRMAVRLAESLAARCGFDADDVLARYVAWWREGAFDTGPVAAGVLARVAVGEAPAAAVENVHRASGGLTAGCNAAHRAAPLAMACELDDAALREAARHEAQLTHYDPAAGEVSAAIVVACRALLCGKPWDAALVAAAASAGHPTTHEALDAAARGPGGRGGFAPEVLRAAVHFVGRARDFGAALDDALAFAGPANYAPVLVGALAGARWGATGVRPADLAHPAVAPIRERIEYVAIALARAWATY